MTMTIIVSMGLIGLVVDEGWAYWRQEACLTAAQSAATAAARYIQSNVSGTITCTNATCQAPTACPSVSGNSPTSAVQAACMYAKSNGFQASGKQNVTVEAQLGNPPTASGVTSSYYVTVRVAESVPLTFLSVIARQTSSLVSANATSAIVSTTAAPCIYVLDGGNTSHALEANNNAFVEATCGIYVNSTSSTAAHATGSACVQTQSGSNRCTGGSNLPNINVVGSSATDNAGAFWPAPQNGSSAVADPLSTVETPWCASGNTCPATNCEYSGCSSAGCTYTTVSVTTAQSTPQVLQPGVYCGNSTTPAISVSNGSSVTFSPGMYVINGGGVAITSGSQNSGSGVIFYLTGTRNSSGVSSNYAGFTVSNGVSGLTLTPPTSGGLAGVLIYQDRLLTSTTVQNTPGNNCGNTYGASAVCGGASSSFKGIVYLPNSTMQFTNGTNTASAMSLVVKDVLFNGGSYLFNYDPYGTLRGGSGNAASYLVGAH